MEFFNPVILAFIIAVVSAPFAIYLSKRNGFYASTNHRSSHVSQVPNTGGIILSFSIIIPLLIFSDYIKQDDFNLVASAFVVLLITGVIDDFNPMPVYYKFLGQFIPAIVIVSSFSFNDLTIPFLNVGIPVFLVYFFWIIFIVVIINAYNLIDGIDGLASGLGIVGSVFFAIVFYKAFITHLVVFSLVLAGGLTGLLFYNFSKKRKIFIGDTGSLLIGGIMGYFALEYLNLSDGIEVNRKFTLILGTFFLPLSDLLRVIIVRVQKGMSPFSADKGHIHHILLERINNHAIVTAILLFNQILLISIFWLYSNYVDKGYIFFLSGMFICYLLLVKLIRKRNK